MYFDPKTTHELIEALETIRSKPGKYVILLEPGATYALTEPRTGRRWAMPAILEGDYDITIQGLKATLAVNSHEARGIFRFGGNVTLRLENLTLANARSMEPGSAISMTGGALHLDHVTFLNNQAYQGTAVQVRDTDLICVNSRFIGNHSLQASCSPRTGATVDFSGVEASLDIRDSLFCSNTFGLRVGNAGAAHIARTTFVNNGEGGVAVDGAVVADLRQCHFRDNNADYGGGIQLSRGTARIDGCAFLNNHARYEGGAVYVSPVGICKSLQIQGSCFFYNTTDTCAGGIYLGNKVDQHSYITHCHFAGNQGIALDYAGSGHFNATENTWHGIGGPSGIGEGDGDTVYGKVNYVPHNDSEF